LKETTVGYAGHGTAWQNNTSTKWWQGLDKIAQARKALAPTPAPPSAWGVGAGRRTLGDSYTPQMGFQVATVDRNAMTAAKDMPGTRVQFYRSAISCNVGYDTSIPHAQAFSNGWLMKDSAGKLLINRQYPDNHILDPSIPAVAAAVAQNSVAYCKANGFVGIWLDDVVRYPLGLLNAMPAGWDNDRWHREVVAHVGRLGDAVKAAGFDVCANSNGWMPNDNRSNDGTLEALFWTELAPHVTDLCAEYWLQNPNATQTVYRSGGTDWLTQFNGWRSLHSLCQRLGVGFMPIQYGAKDSPELIYARAAFLLDYDGGRSCLVSEATNGLWTKQMGAGSSPASSSRRARQA
jgi:hypothetical protein